MEDLGGSLKKKKTQCLAIIACILQRMTLPLVQFFEIESYKIKTKKDAY